VYCRVDMRIPGAPRRTRPSWEHIINDATIITRENIVRCCIGCNASKGTKSLSAWLASRYCSEHSITLETISPFVRAVAFASDPCLVASNPSLERP
jgi:hypothetical protein